MRSSTSATTQSPASTIWAIHGRPWLMSAYHRHNDIEINFLERGTMSYLFSRGRCDVPEGAFAVFWAMFPHRVVTVDDDTSFYCLHIPLGAFLQWRLPQDLVADVLHGNIVVDRTPSTVAVDMAQFPLWYDDLSHGDIDKAETVHLEISARLQRVGQSMRRTEGASIGLTPTQSATRPPIMGESDKLGRMTSFIAERYTEEVTPADVAEHVGLHPKYAMSLFRKAFDMTVVEYVTQLRISHAQRLLATTDRKIVDLAIDAGFGSISQFYDAFARVCRCTPSEFRAGLRRQR